MNFQTSMMLSATILAAGAAKAGVTVPAAVDFKPVELHVQPTPRGPWTSLAELGADHTLNPMGDLLGDGYPGHAVLGDTILAAWSRPSRAELQIALFDGQAWVSQTGTVTDESTFGTPAVHALTSGWVVLTRRLGPTGSEVHGVGVSIHGLLGPGLKIADGLLLGSTVTPADEVVVAIERDGTIGLVWLAARSALPDQPIFSGRTGRLGQGWVANRSVLPDGPISIFRAGDIVLGRALGFTYSGAPLNSFDEAEPADILRLGSSEVLLTLSDDGLELGVSVLGRDPEHVMLPARLTPGEAPSVKRRDDVAKLTWDRPDGSQWTLVLDPDGIRKGLKVRMD